MGKTLVIVESPSKAKKINAFLGDDYIVKASVGHIRDLPKNGTTKSTTKETTTGKRVKKADNDFEKMGVDPNDKWRANYVIMDDKKKVVTELKALAKESDKIYLATDPDREGEAIAWHLREVLGGKKDRFWRVTYNEITKNAILKAFQNPKEIDMSLVEAQMTRRYLDRVVGFKLSPLLWKKVGRGLSAGRVQSVAVEIIVDREKEIKNFNPEEYWTIDAKTKTQNKENLNLSLFKKDGKSLDIHNEKEASAIEKELKKNKFIISSVEQKSGKTSPKPPFTTSTLQQVANQVLGFSVSKTMLVAQKLYENGYITYMRTDSVNLSQEAIVAARDVIKHDFGDKYLPKTPNYYKSKGQAQEAHEAIRPSYATLKAEDLPASIEKDARKLYNLIYQRYLSCQMTPQEYLTTTILVDNGQYQLKTLGRVVTFDGFRAVWKTSSDEVVLPNVAKGDELKLVSLDKAQHFTQPPARYTEASLVKELEKDGIGRPSTYSAIIKTISERGYVRLERGKFYAEKTGEVVTERLMQSFTDLMDKQFTADMEKQLDNIAEGHEDWIKCLDDFYSKFKTTLDKASLPESDGGMAENVYLELDYLCPKCGKYNMILRSGKTGTFLTCMGYNDKSVHKDLRCKNTIDLKEIDLNAFADKDLTEEQEAELMRARKRCPKCHAIMDSFFINKEEKLHICSNSPKCQGYLMEKGNFESEYDVGPTIECDKCGSTMVKKSGKFGPYMLCTNEECKHTRKILKNGDVAPPKEDPVDLPELLCKAEGSHYVLRDGVTGVFLAAHNFPKVKEIRAPLVKELKEFKDRIPAKFHYLAEGPLTDNDGNYTEVRFSRKMKKQFLMTQVDGKATGWTAFYNETSKKWDIVENISATKKTSTTKKATSTTKRASTTKKATGTTKRASTTKKATSTTKRTTTKKTTKVKE